MPREQNRGSEWRRWDPHIHAPGTVLNDQFGGEGAWDDYLARLESTEPQIVALGITDYCVLDTYEQVLDAKKSGRLSSIGLVFPNVELRFAIGTDRSSPVNFHLLISPDNVDHILEAKRFLARLKFVIPGDEFSCTHEDLIKLGQRHNPSATSAAAALAEGVNQFKVEVDQFITEWEKSDWIRNNALIAVAGGSTDGSSGLQKDASLAALRQKIERIAHIVFSSSPKQREFWLGRGALPRSEIIETYGNLKPCLHGSDAHKLADVGAVHDDRFTWIKGDLTFEALRQTCMEPELRAFVSPRPPPSAVPSQVISSIEVENAPWFAEGNTIPLNAGLVGIIGARGSGKTALADMIAAGAYSLSAHLNERSFVRRAAKYLTDATAELTWLDGETTSNDLGDVDFESVLSSPHVQYLSQHFVEKLCSSEGATDELVEEIERVIYAAHPQEDRQGATNFRELLIAKTALGIQKRASYEQAIKNAGEEIARARDKLDGLPALERRKANLRASIIKDQRSKSLIVTKGGAERAKEFDEVTATVERMRAQIGQIEKQISKLRLLKSEVANRREHLAETQLRQLKEKYHETGLHDQEWNQFLTDFVGDVDSIIDEKLRAARKYKATLHGQSPLDASVKYGSGKAAELSLIPEGEGLEKQTLFLLEAEAKRLEALVGIDSARQKQLSRLSTKIGQEKAVLEKVEGDIKEAKAKKEVIKALSEARNDSYARVFDGIVAEEDALCALYKPLGEQLAGQEGAVSKLTVSIRRQVDAEGWSTAGEDLLDLRKSDGFRGQGALYNAVKSELQGPWESGTADEVGAAMAAFRQEHRDKLIAGALVSKTKDPVGYREWATKVTEWLYSTNHIKVTYSLQFETVDIEQLSPGTRGIVLLLLYLAIDQDDDRPLIIDQPEENLDPKSIFDELVGRIRDVKLRRQIIIVTHNANLIVNTDADQVIVAECGPHRPSTLPELTYKSGGLESLTIRRAVCDILEGGEDAFRERAKRLRVHLAEL